MANHQTDAMNVLSSLETEKEELQQQVTALEESRAGDRTKFEGDLQSAKREIEVLKQVSDRVDSLKIGADRFKRLCKKRNRSPRQLQYRGLGMPTRRSGMIEDWSLLIARSLARTERKLVPLSQT
jgi:hypothetical protein